MDQLKRKLDYHYKYFDKEKISPDPLEFPHLYADELDIEAIALISSIFAYGKVEQIIASLGRINRVISPHPYEFIVNYNFIKDSKHFADIKHRFYTGNDIALLFYILHVVYTRYRSLKELFLLYYFEQEKTLKESIAFFSQNMLSIARHMPDEMIITPGLEFMFPDPVKGSACKRINLFLRWMVRKDELDFGLWQEVSKDKLVIPVDTHVARICRELGLTTHKNVNWTMAEEITDNLRKYDRKDPVKYDFAICHIGMRKMQF